MSGHHGRLKTAAGCRPGCLSSCTWPRAASHTADSSPSHSVASRDVERQIVLSVVGGSAAAWSCMRPRLAPRRRPPPAPAEPPPSCASRARTASRIPPTASPPGWARPARGSGRKCGAGRRGAASRPPSSIQQTQPQRPLRPPGLPDLAGFLRLTVFSGCLGVARPAVAEVGLVAGVAAQRLCRLGRARSGRAPAPRAAPGMSVRCTAAGDFVPTSGGSAPATAPGGCPVLDVLMRLNRPRASIVPYCAA
ncbi:hypothetical protein SGRIM128S_09663 [Streptomyces griseomycini]